MELFTTFKKDYLNYLISIIFPSIISGISVPIFKHILGPEKYGYFSIWLNAILILVAVLSAWISQSVLRFYQESENKQVFTQKTIMICLKTQLLFFLPVFFVAYFFSNEIITSVLSVLLLIVISHQFSVLAIIQSGFLSKKVIWSELLRTTSFFVISIYLLKFTKIIFIHSLLLSSLISYFLSLIYLALQLKRKWIKTEKSISLAIDFKLLASFFKYGAPMSLWFIFFYLLSYIDKIFMLKFCGPVFQGNYQAIFDLIYKSIGIIISPVTTSLFPILVLAYQNSNTFEIKKLLKKILFFEIIALTVTTFMYWLFGADLLLHILKINPTSTYKWIGFIVLLTGFIWQFSVLINKKFELKKQSKILLFVIIVSFLAQMLFYFLFQKNKSPLIFPLGFLFSALMYLFLISFTELITILKQKLNPNFSSL